MIIARSYSPVMLFSDTIFSGVIRTSSIPSPALSRPYSCARSAPP
jgi:hypothetical protein